MIDKVLAGADLIPTKENPSECWLVVGRMSTVGFELIEVKKTATHLLAKDLAVHKTLDMLAINTPLGLPITFINYLAGKKLKKSYDAWGDLLADLAFMPYDELVGYVREFGKDHKRKTDIKLSSLKRANPPLLQYMLHSIKILATLDPARFFVLPFQDKIPFGCAVFEVDTAAVDEYLHLHDTDYVARDKQDAGHAEARREKVVHNLIKLKERKALTFKDLPTLVIQKHFMHNFLHSDKAIDALICAYSAAVITTSPERFDDPFSSDAIEVLLEGWTYRPAKG